MKNSIKSHIILLLCDMKEKLAEQFNHREILEKSLLFNVYRE